MEAMHWDVLIEIFMYCFPRDSHICLKILVLCRSLVYFVPVISCFSRNSYYSDLDFFQRSVVCLLLGVSCFPWGVQIMLFEVPAPAPISTSIGHVQNNPYTLRMHKKSFAPYNTTIKSGQKVLAQGNYFLGNL